MEDICHGFVVKLKDTTHVTLQQNHLVSWPCHWHSISSPPATWNVSPLQPILDTHQGLAYLPGPGCVYPHRIRLTTSRCIISTCPFAHARKHLLWWRHVCYCFSIAALGTLVQHGRLMNAACWAMELPAPDLHHWKRQRCLGKLRSRCRLQTRITPTSTPFELKTFSPTDAQVEGDERDLHHVTRRIRWRERGRGEGKRSSYVTRGFGEHQHAISRLLWCCVSRVSVAHNSD